MDPLDFLDGKEPADAPVAEQQPTAAPQAEPPASAEPSQDGPARGPDGKFISSQAQPAPAQPAVPEPAPQPVAQPVEPGHVPISAMLDEREKRQALERQLAELQRQQQPAPKAPDRYEDPDGYDRFMQEQTDQRLYDMRVEMSERFAESRYGAETVQKAVDWGYQRCASDPHFNAQVRANPDPIAFVVQQHQREEMYSTVGDKFDLAQYQAFLAWQAAQTAQPNGQQQSQSQPATAPAPATPAVQPPPRSLVHAPQAGGGSSGALSPEDAFAGAFPK